MTFPDPQEIHQDTVARTITKFFLLKNPFH